MFPGPSQAQKGVLRPLQVGDAAGGRLCVQSSLRNVRAIRAFQQDPHRLRHDPFRNGEVVLNPKP
jgi:hypothetical protein